ncbi:MAG: DUF1189 domain-containing protein, partial [Clostridiales bacterium]|nr:DUF1189 domain-containing protein [Clostridiales bacterium]
MEVVDYKYESSKTSFFRRFTKSFYKFNEYNDLVDTSVKSSVLYGFLMTLAIALLFAVLNIPMAVSLVKTVINAIPEFEIKDGRLITAEPLEYIYDDTVNITVRIDPNETDVENLRKDKDYRLGIFIGEKEFLIENRKFVLKYAGDREIDKGKVYEIISLERFNGMNESKLKRRVVLTTVLSFIIYIISCLIVRAVFIFFLGCIARSMSSAYNMEHFGFWSSVKLVIYASTPAFILKNLCVLAGVNLPLLIYWGIILIYI